MSEQRHRIKRQVLEVATPNREETEAFYEALRRIYDARIVPMIDQCCSELSRPEEIIRLDTVTLDLGALDLENLEEDLVSKCRIQLRKQLSDEINRRAQVPGEETGKPFSQLELLEIFTRTGRFPWWADATDRKLLQHSLHDLIQNAPNILSRLLQGLVQEGPALDRMITHFDDQALSALCALRLQSHKPSSGAVSQYLQLLISASARFKVSNQRRVLSSRQVRTEFWKAVLGVLYSKTEGMAEAVPFLQAVFSRLARRFHLSFSEFISSLRAEIETTHISGKADILKMIETLSVEKQNKKTASVRDHREKPFSESSDPVAQEILNILDNFRRSGAYLALLYAPFREILISLPVDFYPEYLRQLKDLEVEKAGIVSEDERIKEALREMLRTLPSRNKLSEPLVSRCLAAVADEGYEHSLQRHFSDLQQHVQRRFDDVEEQYIENAGLVILWPFLSPFFENVGLTETNQFKDGEAVQRAVALLQYLASEETDPPEYDLVLNRILCGMDLERVFHLDAPVSETEAQECTQLIQSVIAQVPILKKMSVSGFRGTFLIRKGVLSRGNGAWLLRVERATFDVVLDRFPWGMNWIKLPWMTIPLQVEW